MAVFFNYPRHFLNFSIFNNDSGNNTMVIDQESENLSCIVYTFILPVICIAGVFGNVLSFLVLLKMPLKCSSYTYLTVKTAADTINCLLLLVSVITHGFFYNVDGEDFDLLITLPVASIFNGVSVLATLGVTLDRCMYLWDPTSIVRPAYCSPPVARRIMALASIFSFLFNLPYFFIFVLQSDGNLHATRFFKSRLYFIYNWFRLTVFGIIPCIVLTISTGILIYCIRKVAYTLRHLSVTRKKELLDPTRMSCTLITIVILFVIGELPSLIFSKKAAFVFLYSGDPEMITKDQELDNFRFMSLILGAVNCSCNFLVFYMLHPPFGKGLKVLFSKKEKKPKEQVLVNVFFISGMENNKCKKKHLLYYDVNRLKSYPNKIQEFSTWMSR